MCSRDSKYHFTSGNSKIGFKFSPKLLIGGHRVLPIDIGTYFGCCANIYLYRPGNFLVLRWKTHKQNQLLLYFRTGSRDYFIWPKSRFGIRNNFYLCFLSLNFRVAEYPVIRFRYRKMYFNCEKTVQLTTHQLLTRIICVFLL